MIRRRTTIGVLALLPVLLVLVGVQVRWLAELEEARGAELTAVLRQSAARLAESFDEAFEHELAESLPLEVSAAVAEPLIARVLGEDALATYRVEIVSADGSREALFRSHPEDGPARTSPAAGAPVFREPSRWVGFFGEDTAGTASWQEVDMPLTPGPADWLLTIHLRGGSVAEVVARGRSRNQLLAGGLVFVLAAGVVVLLLGERRARRLAEQELLFVAGVSHELRTPLTVIRTAASNLERGITDDPRRAREYGALIGREAERMGARVDRALRFADRERTSEPDAEIALSEVVEEAVESCRHWRDRRKFRVDVDVDANLPRLRGDRAALVSALGNLVDNAIKYGPDGQTIRVSAALEGEGLAVRVADEGPGVARADARRIFEPFHRAKSARNGGETGAGLGLAVAARVARDHGGDLRLDAGTGGARFTLRLPVNGSAT